MRDLDPSGITKGLHDQAVHRAVDRCGLVGGWVTTAHGRAWDIGIQRHNRQYSAQYRLDRQTISADQAHGVSSGRVIAIDNRDLVAMAHRPECRQKIGTKNRINSLEHQI